MESPFIFLVPELSICHCPGTSMQGCLLLILHKLEKCLGRLRLPVLSSGSWGLQIGVQ